MTDQERALLRGAMEELSPGDRQGANVFVGGFISARGVYKALVATARENGGMMWHQSTLQIRVCHAVCECGATFDSSIDAADPCADRQRWADNHKKEGCR